MATQRFTTTRLSGLRVAGRISELQHSVLAPFLERELGPRHGQLFADFEAESSDVRAWYADVDAAPRRAADLPPEQALAIRATTAELVGDVRTLAERLVSGGPHKAALSRMLLAATTFPEEDVWCDGGQPIIVNWGFHRHEIAPGTPRAILDAGRSRGMVAAAAPEPSRREPSASDTPFAGADAFATATGIASRARRSSLAAGLWLWVLFALLVGACYRILLPACGLDNAWSLSRLGGLDACAADGVQADGAAEGARLQALVRQAELRVAEERRICTPVAATPRDTEGQVERRLPADAPRGEIEISLLWEGHADLDLIVDCPDGQKLSQSSDNLTACGGRLLRDINKAGETLLDHPIEHAAWSEPPIGSYRVEVQLFGYNDVAAGSDVPFTVRVHRGAGEQLFQGHVRGAYATVTVAKVTF